MCERETDRETERGTENRETETERDKDTDREIERQRDRDRTSSEREICGRVSPYCLGAAGRWDNKFRVCLFMV